MLLGALRANTLGDLRADPSEGPSNQVGNPKGVSLLLLFWPDQIPPPAPSVINFSSLLGELWPALNATGPQDSIWWTSQDLLGYAQEGLLRVARNLAIFVRYDQSITTVEGTGLYELPDDQVSTVQADLNGFVLRPRNVQEMEALDSLWLTTQGSPNSFLQDQKGTGTIFAYPTPDSSSESKLLGLTIHFQPPSVQSGGFLVASTFLQDYFRFYILGEARRKECKGEMLDASKFWSGLSAMMEDAMQQVFGSGGGGGAR